MGKVEAVGERGRPPVKWEERLLEYVKERRDDIERTRASKKGMGENGNSSVVVISMGGGGGSI